MGACANVRLPSCWSGVRPAGNFTQNPADGSEVIKASPRHKAGCAAAIMEVIVEAMNLYAREHDDELFSRIPSRSSAAGVVHPNRNVTSS